MYDSLRLEKCTAYEQELSFSAFGFDAPNNDNLKYPKQFGTVGSSLQVIYIYIYICIYVLYIYIYMYLYVYIYIYIYLYLSLSLSMYIYIYIYSLRQEGRLEVAQALLEAGSPVDAADSTKRRRYVCI